MAVAEVQQKLTACKRWLPTLRRAIDEYHGASRQLSGFLEADHVRALALLQQRLGDLEAYVHLAPPTVASPVESARSGGEEKTDSASTNPSPQ